MILGHPYTVRYQKHIRGNLSGVIWYRSQSIYVLSGLAPNRKAEVLLHECLHGIWFHMGLDNSESKAQAAREESIVQAFGEGILALFGDNPMLVRALGAASRFRWCGARNIWAQDFPHGMNKWGSR